LKVRSSALKKRTTTAPRGAGAQPEADILGIVHPAPGSAARAGHAGADGVAQIGGGVAGEQRVAQADRRWVVRVAAADQRQPQHRAGGRGRQVGARQPQTSVEALDRVERPVVAHMRRDAQPTLRVDGGDRRGGRLLRGQRSLDEQRQQVPFRRRNLLADDDLDPVGRCQPAGFQRALDRVVVGDRDHSQIGARGDVLKHRLDAGGPIAVGRMNVDVGFAPGLIHSMPPHG